MSAGSVSPCAWTTRPGERTRQRQLQSGSPIFAAALAAGKMLGLRAEKLNQDMGMCVLFHKQFTNLQQATPQRRRPL